MRQEAHWGNWSAGGGAAAAYLLRGYEQIKDTLRLCALVKPSTIL